MPNENQEQSEIQPVEVTTADGTIDPAASADPVAPASDVTQTTPPPIEPAASLPRGKVADVDDYNTRLAKALAPADPATEQPAGEIPPAVEPLDPDAPASPVASIDGRAPVIEPSKKEFRPRLSGLDARTQEAILLVKDLKDQGQDITLSEGERRIALKYGEPAQSVAPEVVPPAAALPTSEGIEAQIRGLKADRKAASSNIDTEKMDEITNQIEDLTIQLFDARANEKEANNRAESDFSLAVEDSRARTVQVYPVAADQSHPITAEAARIWKDLEAQANPLIFDQNAPFKVFQMAANNLGIAPGSVASAPKSSTSATPKPQAVIQSAVRRPNPVPVASGAEHTTNGPTAPVIFGKSRSPHEYNLKLKAAGLSGV